MVMVNQLILPTRMVSIVVAMLPLAVGQWQHASRSHVCPWNDEFAPSNVVLVATGNDVVVDSMGNGGVTGGNWRWWWLMVGRWWWISWRHWWFISWCLNSSTGSSLSYGRTTSRRRPRFVSSWAISCCLGAKGGQGIKFGGATGWRLCFRPLYAELTEEQWFSGDLISLDFAWSYWLPKNLIQCKCSNYGSPATGCNRQLFGRDTKRLEESG